MNEIEKDFHDNGLPQGLPKIVEQQSLYRLPQVLKIVPVGRSTWWDGISKGRFPAGIKLGKRLTVWRSSEIQALISSLK